MQENHPIVKEDNPDLVAKEIISILAKQWGDMSPEEKAEWKARALATHADDATEGDVAYAAAAAAAAEDTVDDEEALEEEGEEEEEDEDDVSVPPARKSKRGKK